MNTETKVFLKVYFQMIDHESELSTPEECTIVHGTDRKDALNNFYNRCEGAYINEIVEYVVA